MKPKVFIGSSSEGLKIANAVHANLTREAECTVWNHGIFNLSQNTLTDLIRVLRDSDFGIFVFSPDDMSIMRGTINSSVRDNVIFELGLFIGRLGPERSFFLIPDNVKDLRLPTDLAGRTPGVYEGERSDGNWLAALSPACMQIAFQMGQLKPFQDAAIPEDGVEPQSTKTPSPKKRQKSTATKKSSTLSSAADGTGVEARNYKKMILLTGETKPIKETLKSFGGRWITSLLGWTISPEHMSNLMLQFPQIRYVDEEWSEET